MARTNKYASINFNDIYEKKINHPTKPTSSSSSLTNPNKTLLSSSRTHGGMLVLTRPSPKPQPQPPPPPPPPPPSTPPQVPDQSRSEPDSISLRPSGRTGTGTSLSSFPSTTPIQERDKDKEFSLPSPKQERFVPPHLRPGFVGREERLEPECQKQLGFRSREIGQRQGHYGSPNRYGEDGRPKSGEGYERMRRDGESDPVEMSRPRSSGNRQSSSG